MAFSPERWSENAAGKTGFGRMAVYDGSGSTAEGGDDLNTIRGVDFFNHAVPRAAVRDIVNAGVVGGLFPPGAANPERGVGPHDNAGLLVWLKANNGQAVDILYELNRTVAADGSMRIRGTGIS